MRRAPRWLLALFLALSATALPAPGHAGGRDKVSWKKIEAPAGAHQRGSAWYTLLIFRVTREGEPASLIPFASAGAGGWSATSVAVSAVPDTKLASTLFTWVELRTVGVVRAVSLSKRTDRCKCLKR